ncbi:hypothetical protein D9757_013961 [Collybiopsis confluens]|uniref:Heme haloperoxidase family profile domain-containing protein n=1 Tax=Collybiopsis confluens TaxID=2823264 RepID=A0A8H5CME1_9AGAR|nr:hypothetical protein D9757_013961 [Collybiopsis confluens]
MTRSMESSPVEGSWAQRFSRPLSWVEHVGQSWLLAQEWQQYYHSDCPPSDRWWVSCIPTYQFKPIEVLRTAAKLGLLSTDSVDFFSLTDLALPGTLEHDVSLSRSDFALGDNIHFNETIFATLNNSNPGFDFYNTTSAAQVLNQRLETSVRTKHSRFGQCLCETEIGI